MEAIRFLHINLSESYGWIDYHQISRGMVEVL
jgi:hypothetical protein